MQAMVSIAAAVIITGSAVAEAANKQRVTFESQGKTLVGHLYLPTGYDATKQYPAAVVGGSLTSVKEMMAGRYAKELAARGMIALAIDYMNYGESEGKARQLEDPDQKDRDLSAAVSFLASRRDVPKTGVGLVGVCTSGGNVLYTAGRDRRVGAVATVAGWFVEPSIAPVLYGGEEAVKALRKKGRAARESFQRNGKNEIILAYHNKDTTASHVGPMEYYMDTNRGGGVSAWRNGFSVMSWEGWLDFDPVSAAAKVTAPALIIHSDGSALPDQARKVHGLLKGPKTLYWAEGGHFDFYDNDQKVREAADVISAHFHRNLKL